MIHTESKIITLRECLTDKGFNWKRGKILYQEEYEYSTSPGWAEKVYPTKGISEEHFILDKEFDINNIGSPEMPRIICYDDKFVYFPSNDNGNTRIEKIALDPNYYLINNNERTPYIMEDL